jgi:enamine deaminase RidA (YjgF/YER057c/UK114 family)
VEDGEKQESIAAKLQERKQGEISPWGPGGRWWTLKFLTPYLGKSFAEVAHKCERINKMRENTMTQPKTGLDAVAVKETHKGLSKKAIHAPQVLNEAHAYAAPSSFSRGMRLDIKGVTILLISGTASVDEHGSTAHKGDFRAQTWRTYENIAALLESEGASWKDVVRTTCYLRDIERDYAVFNEIRTKFFQQQGLDPLPASTGIQAILCRPDLLIEIEAMAIFESDHDKTAKNR